MEMNGVNLNFRTKERAIEDEKFTFSLARDDTDEEITLLAAKTIKIKRKKVGKAKKLKLSVGFAGNSFVKAGSKAYTLKVK